MTTITIISGSHRIQGESSRVANYVSSLITKQDSTSTVHNIDISSVPFWDEGKWGEPSLAEKWNTIWSPISEKLQTSDALIFITPEYGGMASPKIANFLLIAGSHEVGHKPALLISVSASRGGAYPIAQLRSFAYKNNHLCWIPDHVIVRNVKEYLEDVNNGVENYTDNMMKYAVTMLFDYADALGMVRAKGNINYKDFPYGM